MIRLKLPLSYINELALWTEFRSIKNDFDSFAHMASYASLFEMSIKLKKWLCSPRANKKEHLITLTYAEAFAFLHYVTQEKRENEYTVIVLNAVSAKIYQIVFARGKFRYPLDSLNLPCRGIFNDNSPEQVKQTG